ncbi:MAG: DUF6504 family protein [candidate division WOR-3 bacterium]|nr:DUF6504 family protein [candidate division WOR-3 bacterium]
MLEKDTKDRKGEGRFIGERIEVVTSEEEPAPLSFIWRGKEYQIEEIIRSWHDHGFSPAAPRKRTWLLRRHRNVYVVQTDAGERFEIYMDHGAGRRNWYLYRELK